MRVESKRDGGKRQMYNGEEWEYVVKEVKVLREP
jgi:hypothetical protein